jgi:hypothetical protein
MISDKLEKILIKWAWPNLPEVTEETKKYWTLNGNA